MPDPPVVAAPPQATCNRPLILGTVVLLCNLPLANGACTNELIHKALVSGMPVPGVHLLTGAKAVAYERLLRLLDINTPPEQSRARIHMSNIVRAAREMRDIP